MTQYLRTTGPSRFFVLGEVCAELLPPWSLPGLGRAWEGLQKAGVSAPAVNAILFGIFAAFLENIRIWWLMRRDVATFIASQPQPARWWRMGTRMRFAASAKYITKSSNAALQTWYRASVLQKPVMLTLKSRKVYVGKPYGSLDDPSRDSGSLDRILTGISGKICSLY